MDDNTLWTNNSGRVERRGGETWIVVAGRESRLTLRPVVVIYPIYQGRRVVRYAVVARLWGRDVRILDADPVELEYADCDYLADVVEIAGALECDPDDLYELFEETLRSEWELHRVELLEVLPGT